MVWALGSSRINVLEEDEFFQKTGETNVFLFFPAFCIKKKARGERKIVLKKHVFEKTEWNFRNSTLVSSVLGKL